MTYFSLLATLALATAATLSASSSTCATANALAASSSNALASFTFVTEPGPCVVVLGRVQRDPRSCFLLICCSILSFTVLIIRAWIVLLSSACCFLRFAAASTTLATRICRLAFTTFSCAPSTSPFGLHVALLYVSSYLDLFLLLSRLSGLFGCLLPRLWLSPYVLKYPRPLLLLSCSFSRHHDSTSCRFQRAASCLDSAAFNSPSSGDSISAACSISVTSMRGPGSSKSSSM